MPGGRIHFSLTALSSSSFWRNSALVYSTPPYHSHYAGQGIASVAPDEASGEENLAAFVGKADSRFIPGAELELAGTPNAGGPGGSAPLEIRRAGGWMWSQRKGGPAFGAASRRSIAGGPSRARARGVAGDP